MFAESVQGHILCFHQITLIFEIVRQFGVIQFWPGCVRGSMGAEVTAVNPLYCKLD